MQSTYSSKWSHAADRLATVEFYPRGHCATNKAYSPKQQVKRLRLSNKAQQGSSINIININNTE